MATVANVRKIKALGYKAFASVPVRRSIFRDQPLTRRPCHGGATAPPEQGSPSLIQGPKDGLQRRPWGGNLLLGRASVRPIGQGRGRVGHAKKS